MVGLAWIYRSSLEEMLDGILILYDDEEPNFSEMVDISDISSYMALPHLDICSSKTIKMKGTKYLFMAIY